MYAHPKVGPLDHRSFIFMIAQIDFEVSPLAGTRANPLTTVRRTISRDLTGMDFFSMNRWKEEEKIMFWALFKTCGRKRACDFFRLFNKRPRRFVLCIYPFHICNTPMADGPGSLLRFLDTDGP
jgi:hypothetical protein